jgi:hypothetical protein
MRYAPPLLVGKRVAPFFYRCPTTGLNVQGWFADDVTAEGETYQTVTCLACQQVHLVNPATNKILGADHDEGQSYLSRS